MIKIQSQTPSRTSLATALCTCYVLHALHSNVLPGCPTPTPMQTVTSPKHLQRGDACSLTNSSSDRSNSSFSDLSSSSALKSSSSAPASPLPRASELSSLAHNTSLSPSKSNQRPPQEGSYLNPARNARAIERALALGSLMRGLMTPRKIPHPPTIASPRTTTTCLSPNSNSPHKASKRALAVAATAAAAAAAATSAPLLPFASLLWARSSSLAYPAADDDIEPVRFAQPRSPASNYHLSPEPRSTESPQRRRQRWSVLTDHTNIVPHLPVIISSDSSNKANQGSKKGKTKRGANGTKRGGAAAAQAAHARAAILKLLRLTPDLTSHGAAEPEPELSDESGEGSPMPEPCVAVSAPLASPSDHPFNAVYSLSPRLAATSGVRVRTEFETFLSSSHRGRSMHVIHQVSFTEPPTTFSPHGYSTSALGSQYTYTFAPPCEPSRPDQLPMHLNGKSQPNPVYTHAGHESKSNTAMLSDWNRDSKIRAFVISPGSECPRYEPPSPAEENLTPRLTPRKQSSTTLTPLLLTSSPRLSASVLSMQQSGSPGTGQVSRITGQLSSCQAQTSSVLTWMSTNPDLTGQEHAFHPSSSDRLGNVVPACQSCLSHTVPTRGRVGVEQGCSGQRPGPAPMWMAEGTAHNIMPFADSPRGILLSRVAPSSLVIPDTHHTQEPAPTQTSQPAADPAHPTKRYIGATDHHEPRAGQECFPTGATCSPITPSDGQLPGLNSSATVCETAASASTQRQESPLQESTPYSASREPLSSALPSLELKMRVPKLDLKIISSLNTPPMTASQRQQRKLPSLSPSRSRKERASKSPAASRSPAPCWHICSPPPAIPIPTSPSPTSTTGPQGFASLSPSSNPTASGVTLARSGGPTSPGVIRPSSRSPILRHGSPLPPRSAAPLGAAALWVLDNRVSEEPSHGSGMDGPVMPQIALSGYACMMTRSSASGGVEVSC